MCVFLCVWMCVCECGVEQKVCIGYFSDGQKCVDDIVCVDVWGVNCGVNVCDDVVFVVCDDENYV